MRDSIDELLLSLDLQLAANEGVWSVLRSLAAALHRWSPATVRVCQNLDILFHCLSLLLLQLRKKMERKEEEGVAMTTVMEVVKRKISVAISMTTTQSRQEERQVGEEKQRRGRWKERQKMEVRVGTVVEQCPPVSPAGDLPLSPLEQAAVEVLERCPHYLPSSSSSLSPSLPLTVLDCLHHCLLSLSHNHRTLLPLVHKVPLR